MLQENENTSIVSSARAAEFTALLEKAQAGDSDAQFKLAFQYYRGLGVVKSAEKAIEWWQKLAEKREEGAEDERSLLRFIVDERSEHSLSRYIVGAMYALGLGVLQDEERANFWCEQIAEEYVRKTWGRDNPGIGYAMSLDILQVRASTTTFWFSKVAAKGSVTVKIFVANMYAFGYGSQLLIDNVRALELFEEVDEQTRAKELHLLGKRHASEYNSATHARFWYHEAAKLGHAEAQFDLAMKYHYDSRIEKKDEEATKWWGKAAEKKDKLPLYKLGQMYQYGFGVAQNGAQAAEHYQQAIIRGDGAYQAQIVLDRARREIKFDSSKSRFSGFPPYLPLPIEYSELTTKKELAGGSYSTVYKATWKWYPVAVKELKIQPTKNLDDKILQDFQREVNLMVALRGSPHVITLVAFCTYPYCIIMEYASKGALSDILYSNLIIAWDICLNMAIDIGEGLAWLHAQSPIIIHCDITTQNIFIDQDWNAKIGDFGLARYMGSTFELAGTPAYMPPELFGESPQHHETIDIYSYAIVLYEIAIRKKPYEGMPPYAIANYVKSGHRPDFPMTDAKMAYRNLVMRAWSQQALERPIAADVVHELEKMKIEIKMQKFYINPNTIDWSPQHTQILGQNKTLRVCKRLYVPKKDGGSTPVVVKEFLTQKFLLRVWSDVELMACFKHPHITNFHGITQTRQSPVSYALVMECMACSLHDVLYDNNVLDKNLSLIWRMQIASQIVLAIIYLHETSALHRGIKSRNVLLSEDRQTAKLTDFGISKSIKGGNTDFSCWVAPEFIGSGASKATDIFSLGIVIAEIVNRKIPFEGIVLPSQYPEKIQKGLLVFSDRFFILSSLGRDCTKVAPHQRPTAQQCQARLQFKG